MGRERSCHAGLILSSVVKVSDIRCGVAIQCGVAVGGRRQGSGSGNPHAEGIPADVRELVANEMQLAIQA